MRPPRRGSLSGMRPSLPPLRRRMPQNGRNHCGSRHALIFQAENRLDVIIDAERLQVLGLLTQTEKINRQFQLAPDANERAAARCAIKFGYDQTGEAEVLVEHPR